ncbi:MAG: hypothetical protein ABIV25_05235 [Paracoccaceae bacterium]
MRLLSVAFALLLPTVALGDRAMPMDPSKMDHTAMMTMMSGDAAGVTEGGQSAFAAIAQIVEVLNADPTTDWSKVNVEALRQHLINMDNVTLHAEVAATSTPTGASFNVTSPNPAVQASIRRMVMAHAATMNGANGWTLTASQIDGGSVLTVAGAEADAVKINGMGFIGVLTLGMHHQAHHLMIARGMRPHQ